MFLIGKLFYDGKFYNFEMKKQNIVFRMDAYQALVNVNKARDWVLGSVGNMGHKYEVCKALGKERFGSN